MELNQASFKFEFKHLVQRPTAAAGAPRMLRSHSVPACHSLDPRCFFPTAVPDPGKQLKPLTGDHLFGFVLVLPWLLIKLLSSKAMGQFGDHVVEVSCTLFL